MALKFLRLIHMNTLIDYSMTIYSMTLVMSSFGMLRWIINV